jgi:8-hydroxy-5-deazaflavin:NADPH oxidoreductase
MRIWVIGADPLARALGRSWAQAGHEVLFTFGERTDWDALAAETGCRYGTLAEGAAAEVVLLAAAWSGVGKGLRTAGSLAGKVVLDATNPHEPMVGASGAEEVALRAPEAQVVKAFNTVAAPVVAQAAAAPGRLSLLYCGDYATAKRVAAGLIADAGFVPVDAGRLAAAREVEALGRLLLDLAYGRGPRAGRLPAAHAGGAVDGQWVRAAGRSQVLAAVVAAVAGGCRWCRAALRS